MIPLALLVASGIALAFVRESWAWRIEQTLLLTVAAWCVAIRRTPLQWCAPLFILLALTAWPLMQVLTGVSGYGWAATNAMLMWLAWAAAFYLAVSLWSADRFDLVAAFGTVVAFVALLQRYTSDGGKVYWLFDSGYSTGLMGPFAYHNQYAAFAQLVLPPALVLSFRKGRVQLGWLAASALLIASVVASGSRAGTALILMEAVLVLTLLRAGRRAGALAALVALFVLITGWQLLAVKLLGDKPYQERWTLALSSWEMATERPLTGFGVGTWSHVYPAYARFDDGLFDNHAHNDWLEWAAGGGFPYAVLMLAFGLAIARPALRSIWGVGLLTVLIHCWVDYHFHERPAFGAFYFDLAGAVWQSSRSRLFRTANPNPS